MRSSVLLVPSVLVTSFWLAAACSASDNASISSSDAGGSSGSDGASQIIETETDGSATILDGGPDAAEPHTTANEVEPNDLKTAAEVGAMTLPGTMNGAISPANDMDVFAITLAPGELWSWKATPTTADLAPHVIIFDGAKNDANPSLAGIGAPGQPATLEHFVRGTGEFLVAVRDARNVGAAGNKGGPTFGYSLTATRQTPQPIPVTFPSTKTGKLASLGSIALYGFTGPGKAFDVIVRAERKMPASTLDARLTLFDATAKKWLITNASASGTNDAELEIEGAATSNYIVILENEGEDPSDLSYEIELKLHP